MTNTKFPGKDLHFEIEDAGSTTRIITGVTGVSGLPGEVEHYDGTSVGDQGRKHVAGLANVTCIVEGWYDTTADTGAQVVFDGLEAVRQADQESAIVYGPKGNSSTFPKHSATVKLKNIEYPATLGDLVKFRAELLVQGIVTTGTFI